MFCLSIIRICTHGNNALYVLLVKIHITRSCILLHYTSDITALVLNNIQLLALQCKHHFVIFYHFSPREFRKGDILTHAIFSSLYGDIQNVFCGTQGFRTRVPRKAFGFANKFQGFGEKISEFLWANFRGSANKFQVFHMRISCILLAKF
jgi:hypothetical protein